MTTPVLTRTRAELAAQLTRLDGSTALVMTMGALHDGHLQLVRQAKTLADHVVVSIFVNPTQFAPGEDFDAYPRTLDADMEALTRVGADLVWAPQPAEVYPSGTRVTIDPGPVAHILEGVTRPTHFAGVALVVSKVINLVRPTVALFGQKDAQQLAVIRTVVEDLDVPVRIVGVPIVRDEDGVALSSRNTYLSAEERVRARALSRGLAAAVRAADGAAGSRDVLGAARQVLLDEGGVDIDYVALVSEADFTEILVATGNAPALEDALVETPKDPAPPADGAARILVAARVGTTRLIDNAELTLRATEGVL
ncbi:pantoate--beta-alanine ligase [Schaalia sp. 19OD2882]|uniref:pantoate--beta-alanine ligase n=1 Tax=Schaalia sp. 19OD2882 TaxID=2794089 RepID=UPI001C1EE5FD|nr:pantoate--beta-alanine ligase [Schaalia sp. 19OD2882]QWW19909.1 pantoate--beta-alanine ligase [Schaalia sp. 19OD2882]